MSIQPFVVGQWVRGEKFYGREALIDEILHGHRNCLWLLGTRRIGKTSLLKQIELLTHGEPESVYFPLFWDFQGADDPEELHLGFSDALLDAEDRLEQIDIRPADVEADDLFRSLSLLRRKIRSRERKLLLLCDEVEELIKLNQKDPGTLRRLRKVMQAEDDVRSVLASTIRLWRLAEQDVDTSPFLHGFTPPLYIHALSDAEAHALITQANLPSDSRPKFDEKTIEIIRTTCDNHPYLIQLVSKRYVELEDLQDALEQVAVDPMVSYFFSVDFEMLSDHERGILAILAEHGSSTSNSVQHRLPVTGDELSGLLHRLEHLGYVRRNEERRFVLVNYFFRRWLKTQRTSDGSAGSATTPTINEQSTVADRAKLGPFGERFELLQEAGKGATGVVFKAFDRLLRVEIALKLLRPEYAANPEALERFRKEIVLTRDIAHPNIARIYDLGEIEDRKYLTMKWIDGSTLGREIAEHAPFGLERTLTLARKLSSALDALHGKGILHRDIKPHNIMLDTQGEPYLTDFGLVRLLGRPGTTQSGIFLGTPDYASPEQAHMLELDERSDVYSLGLILFEMAVGHRPFIGDSVGEVLEMHKVKPAPDPRRLRPTIPTRLSSVILRCLEKKPTHRFSNAGELRKALEAL